MSSNTPNNNALNAAWGGYRTSVDAIEPAAGLDILSALPLSVQNVVEARTDELAYTNRPDGPGCGPGRQAL
jgi:DNA/RNA endonuclease G (NUC1)